MMKIASSFMQAISTLAIKQAIADNINTLPRRLLLGETTDYRTPKSQRRTRAPRQLDSPLVLGTPSI